VPFRVRSPTLRNVDQCSFCGKTEHQGVRLVRGPEVAICEECVKLAHDEILPGMAAAERQPGGDISIQLFAQSEASGSAKPEAES
jgi:ATP-dependent protease Clp ATPase subunit